MFYLARSLPCLLGLAALLLNPAACMGPDDAEEFRYGEVEMRAAVEGRWRIEVRPTGASATVVTLTLEQATAAAASPGASRGRPSLIRKAMACDSRLLVRAAAACTSSSEMPLKGRVIEGDERLRGATVKGTLRVLGASFERGLLDLDLGELRVNAWVSRDGTVEPGTLGTGGTVTMVRTAR